jgi:hypothetical protein
VGDRLLFKSETPTTSAVPIAPHRWTSSSYGTFAIEAVRIIASNEGLADVPVCRQAATRSALHGRIVSISLSSLASCTTIKKGEGPELDRGLERCPLGCDGDRTVRQDRILLLKIHIRMHVIRLRERLTLASTCRISDLPETQTFVLQHCRYRSLTWSSG